MSDWVPPNREHAPPKRGEPALHRAARVGDHDAIARLTRAGADINEAFNIGLDPGARPRRATPLMVAAGSGDGASVETVALLLELGADPRVVLDGDSAATFAAKGLGWNYRPGGDVERLGRVLAAGSPLPKRAELANRMLCEAASAGDAARVRVLLRHGLSARGHFDEATARARSESLGSGLVIPPEMQGLLATLPEEMRRAMDEQMQSSLAKDASRPGSFEIPLFCAAESGSVECVRALLEAGADPRAKDNTGGTAMHAVTSVEVARALMAAGVGLEDADDGGWSPLTRAVTDEPDGLARVRALIEAGADVNATHDNGYTVFMSAAGTDCPADLLELLARAGADPHAVSGLGYNAFHAAVDVNGAANHESSVRARLGCLRALGVDMEQRNNVGHTPLARAIEHGTGIEVAVLCELGANVSARCTLRHCAGEACEREEMPLLLHAVLGSGVHRDVKVRSLLDAGADPRVTDPRGHTALAHVVARLVRGEADGHERFNDFYAGLRAALRELRDAPRERRAFVESVIGAMRVHAQAFGRTLVPPAEGEFEALLRAELLECAALLATHEAWAARAGV